MKISDHSHEFRADETERSTLGSNGAVHRHEYENKPVRILHVVGGMDRGGAETWLMHVLRQIDRTKFQMDFLVHTDRPCAYDEELKALGSKLVVCRHPSQPLRYSRNLLRILREEGPYDVVHSHVHKFSGLVLGIAKLAAVPVRIAHSHTAIHYKKSGERAARRVYRKTSEYLIRRYSTARVGASGLAVDSLFGTGWRQDRSASILHCGIDFNPFRTATDPFDVRRELGLNSNDFVVGHVGRFINEKHHCFLLKIHAELLRLNPLARLLLVGHGPLETSIRQMAQELGIADYVRFAGLRGDVPRLMLGAMDVFVLPSLHEGLPLVALEAQAAGLPTLLSAEVTREADGGCGLVEFVSLLESPEEWANRILRSGRAAHASHQVALARLCRSDFSVEVCVRSLCRLYTQALSYPVLEAAVHA